MVETSPVRDLPRPHRGRRPVGRRARRATGVLLAGAVLIGFPIVVGAGTGNDRVLKEDQYIEVFKKEGNGDKNYLYTITEFKDAHGRVCTVVTGASEQAVALDCEFPRG